MTKARLYELAYYHGRRQDHRLVAFLLEHFGAYGAETLLDCACGTGEPGLHLARNSVTTFSDLSTEMLGIAQEKATRLSINANFIQAGWKDLGFRVPRSYDIVVCAGGALAQVEDRGERRRSIAGMAGALKRGGILYLDFISEWPRLTHGYSCGHVIGPLRWRGGSFLIVVRKRVTRSRIDRVKTCFSVNGHGILKELIVKSLTVRLEQAEIKHDLADLGFKDISFLSRPGRWRMTSIIART